MFWNCSGDGSRRGACCFGSGAASFRRAPFALSKCTFSCSSFLPLASPIFFSILESSPPTHSDSHFSSLHRMYFSCSSSLPFASPSIFPIPSVCRALKGGGGTALPPPSTLKVRHHRGFSTLLLSSATKLPLRIYTCNKNCESYDHDHRSSKI